MTADLQLPQSKFSAKWALFFLAFFVLCAHVVMYRELSIVFSFFVLYWIGMRVVRRLAPDTIVLFECAYLINIFFAIVFTQAFLIENGNPYTGIGDDQTIYEMARDFKNGLRQFKDGIHWDGINFKAYLVILSFWLKVLNLAGFKSDYFLNLIMLNAWMGAFIPGLTYVIFKRFSSESAARTIGWISLLYPLTVYYAATLIRDTVVTLVFSIGVVITLHEQLSRSRKLILLMLCVFVMYHIREASAVFLFIFILSFYALEKIKGYGKYFVKFSMLICLIAIFLVLLTALSITPPKLLPAKSDFINYVSHRIHFYNNVAMESSGNSLGAALRASENPLLIAVSLPHLFFSPAPPRFLYGLTTSNIFLGIGNVIWYFFGFCYLFSFLTLPNYGRINSFWWSIFITAMSALVIINFTSGDVRHFSFLHPILMGFAFLFMRNNQGAVKVVIKLCGVLFVLLLTLYIILKMIN